MTDSNQTERWVHEPGDRYAPVFGEWWMLNGGEPTLEYSQLSPPVGSWAQAFVDGVDVHASDDFNIAVIRAGRVVANLWKDEVVDTDPDVLADVAAALGIEQ